MAGDSYQNTYKAYKLGTSTISAWLVNSAKRCGAGQEFQPAKKPSSTTEVPIKQLLVLSRAIASSTDPKIRVPQKIVLLIKSVIALRRQATEFFARISKSKKTSKARAPDVGHDYFISVLEEVLDILHATIEASATATESPELVNVFEVLSLEDTAFDNDANQKDVPATHSGSSSTQQYDIQSSAMENIIIVFAFFKDINSLRRHIESLWHDYRHGKLELMSAAVTTDTAWAMMRRSSEEVLQAIPSAQNWAGLVNVLITYGENFGGMSDDFMDWVCGGAAQKLDAFSEVISPGNLPEMKPGHFGIYNPKQDRSKMSDRAKETEDMIILMELLPEFAKIAATNGNLPVIVQDELTTGLVKMCNGYHIDALPMYAIFATQSLLDIHHTLREDATRPFTELQSTGKRVITTVDDYFRYSRNHKIMNWPPENDDIFRNVKGMADDWTQKDIMAACFTKSRILKPRPFWLLKNHPVLAGLMAFKLNMLLQEGGMNVCTAWGSVLYPAHLYNATRHSARMQSEWKDMDYVISVHSPQRIFVGSPPTEPQEYLKRFLLTLGASASIFARNRRPTGRETITESKKGPRGLKTTSPVKDVFRERYVYDKVQNAALTTPNLVAMISVASKAERTSQPSVDLQLFSRQMIVQRQYTPIQLLQIVRESVAAEELHLLFDYFSLHQRGCKLLRTLQTHVHAKMVEYFGEEYIEDESQLPYVIGYIFEIVAGADRVGEAAGIPSENRGSNLLFKAADVLMKFLESEEGERSICRAKALSQVAVRCLRS